MSAHFLLFVACAACAACAARAPAPPAPPANHGGNDEPPAHELRLDVTNLPREVEIDPVAPIDLVVISRVAGAEVIVDGEVVGYTPVRAHVRAGKHHVRVYAEGF